MVDATRHTGVIKHYNPVIRVGYIIPDNGGGDVLFNRDNCTILSADQIFAGRRVEYTPRRCEKGWRASEVTIAEIGRCPCCGAQIKGERHG
jgi:cold shock CspA family protein